jgi:putative flippase GtrA
MPHRPVKMILADLRRLPLTLNHEWAGEMLRFLIGGVLNVVVGYGSYLILLHWVRYEMAYAIAYVLGIIVSYVFNAFYVFRQPMRWRSALRYPLVYLLQFLLGLVLLKILVEVMHMSQRFAPLVVAVLTIPATFLASRTIIRTN